MAYDEALAARIRERIGEHPAFSQRRMFGGIAFMIGGNMAVGVAGDELMVRVGDGAHEEALAQPGVRPFDLSGRPMAGWILVARDGFPDEESFGAWVDQGIAIAEGLPSK